MPSLVPSSWVSRIWENILKYRDLLGVVCGLQGGGGE